MLFDITAEVLEVNGRLFEIGYDTGDLLGIVVHDAVNIGRQALYANERLI